MTKSKSGQPKIQEWERIRVQAWTDLVRREVQLMMDDHLLGNLGKDSPFYPLAKVLASRWSVPQRRSQFTNTLTMNDLGAIFLGARDGTETRTDFSAYAKGQNARPKQSLIENVDQFVPGSSSYYNVGPFGLPLWAALQGKNCDITFWSPFLSAKVFRATEWHDYVRLLKSLSPETETKKVLLETTWQSWTHVLWEKLQSGTSQAVELRGLAIILALVVSQASQTSIMTGLVEKEVLLATLPKFSDVWSLFDVNYQIEHRPNTPTNTKSIVGNHILGLQSTLAAQVQGAKDKGLL